MLCTALVLGVWKRTLFELDLKIALRVFFKYSVENDLQIKNVFGLNKRITEMFSAALFLNVANKKHVLSKLDLKAALQTFFKYDLENAIQTTWHLKNGKQMFCTGFVLSVGKTCTFPNGFE